MTVTFREATAVRERAPGEFEATVPDRWQQGKGAFGGVVFGLLVRAALASESDGARQLRTFSSDITGPVLPGPVALRVRTLRRGRSQSNLHVELAQNGDVLALANVTLSADRGVAAPAFAPAAPTPPSFRDVAPLVIGSPPMPVFTQHYEFRNVGNLGPLFFRAHAHTQREGYSVEFRELWSGGQLLALNQQTFAILSA